MVNLSVVLALWMGLELFQAGTVTGPMVVLLPIALLGLQEIYSMLPDAFARLGARSHLLRHSTGTALQNPPKVRTNNSHTTVTVPWNSNV